MTTDRSLRIGIYADKYKPASSGGVDGYFVSIVDALARYLPQHEYTILAQPQNLKALQQRFQTSTVRIHGLNSSLLWARFHRLLRRSLSGQVSGEKSEINGLKLDVVYFPRNVMHVWGLSMPTIVNMFDIQHEYYPSFFSSVDLEFRTKRYKESADQARVVVVPTHYTKQTIVEKLNIDPERVRVVYPGPVTIHDQTDSSLVESMLHRYHLPADFMIYPANSWIHKNHARLLAALRSIREQYHRELSIVFTGQLSSEAPANLQRLAIAAGVETQVFSLGFVPDIDLAALYSVARFMIFPSLFEGFGFPVLEAMKFGCPVTSSSATCLPEVAGDAAFYFDPDNTQAIADSILTMWDDEELRSSLREKGFARIKSFSWEKCAHELNGCFQVATTAL